MIIWGTSSGANIAQLVGLTAGDAEYETEEYAEYSDEVNAVVSCFAPSNVPALELQVQNLYSADPKIRKEQEKKMSPYHLVKKGKKYPPFLLMHGTADKMVCYTQMIEMYQKLYDTGADVKAYLVDGADHEGNFWSDEVHQTISEFIKNVWADKKD